MSIINLLPGDKVKLNKQGLGYAGHQLTEVYEIEAIIQCSGAYNDHILAGHGVESAKTCSCCNFAKLKGLDKAFFIEEGHSELDLVDLVPARKA